MWRVMTRPWWGTRPLVTTPPRMLRRATVLPSASVWLRVVSREPFPHVLVHVRVSCIGARAIPTSLSIGSVETGGTTDWQDVGDNISLTAYELRVSIPFERWTERSSLSTASSHKTRTSSVSITRRLGALDGCILGELYRVMSRPRNPKLKQGLALRFDTESSTFYLYSC